MSSEDPTHEQDSRTDDTADPRYAVIRIEDGGQIIYDRENPDAWVQADGSDATMEVRT